VAWRSLLACATVASELMFTVSSSYVVDLQRQRATECFFCLHYACVYPYLCRRSTRTQNQH
jgi:hypothetical protein